MSFRVLCQRLLPRVLPSQARHGSSQSTVQVKKREDGVANVTLTSPKTRNTLSLVTMQTMIEEISALGQDTRVRSIVLRGEGKVFSSGHNLKEMTKDSGCDHMKIFHTCEELMLLLSKVPVPVISVVTGLAAAAGCQLVASCDIVLATHSASFSTPGASVGLFCHTPGIPLARKVPRAVSGYMLLTGNTITAAEAYNAGLVSKLLLDEELEPELERTCAAIASKPRGVIAFGKKFYHRQIELPLAEAYPEGSKVMAENLTFKDAQEGISAFKEKRKPVFQHTDDRV